MKILQWYSAIVISFLLAIFLTAEFDAFIVVMLVPAAIYAWSKALDKKIHKGFTIYAAILFAFIIISCFFQASDDADTMLGVALFVPILIQGLMESFNKSIK